MFVFQRSLIISAEKIFDCYLRFQVSVTVTVQALLSHQVVELHLTETMAESLQNFK